MTRRDLAAAVTAAAALASSRAAAQETPKPEAAKPDAAKTEPDLIEQARRQSGQNTRTLATFKIDIAVEPAFQFKA